MAYKPIPVRPLAQHFSSGIAIGKIMFKDIRSFEEADHSHRHDYHFFLLHEKGSATIEIDFENFQLKRTTISYIHPSQVHRIVKFGKNVSAHILAINDENIKPDYLRLLEEISPAEPLSLSANNFITIREAISLCINIFSGKVAYLYSAMLKDSCNTLIALVISKYLEKSKQTGHLSRFDNVSKNFKLLLEKDFIRFKRASDYAKQLNISTPYLNECVKKITGFTVTYHIQRRIILEAKRLLYYSDKSVKSIAAHLGYEDYAYFSRLFTKVTGMTALAFRRKNCD